MRKAIFILIIVFLLVIPSGFAFASPTVTVFNVTDYGATGNGSTDDTTSIQNTLNAAHTAGGGIVYFPPGVYKTSANLLVYSNTTVQGNDAKVSKIDSTNGYAVFEIAANQTDVLIEKMWIENNKSSGSNGIEFDQNVQRVRVLNDKFTGITEQAVFINQTGVADIQVRGNDFEQVAWGVLTGLSATDVKDVRVVDNQFKGIYRDAVEFNHPSTAGGVGTNLLVADNYMTFSAGTDRNSGFGVGIAGASYVTITGNVIVNARYEAIHIEDHAKHITITGNVINGTQNTVPGIDSGIYAIDGDDVTIANNAIDSVQDYGIHLEFAPNAQLKHAVITGNTVTNSINGGGIRVAGTNDVNVVVSQNILNGNNGDGIHVGGNPQNLKITDNIARSNTGHGLYMEQSGNKWTISGNSFDSNTLGDIGYLTPTTTTAGYTFPVPLLSNENLINTSVASSNSYTPWSNAFSLGTGAAGYLYVTATEGVARDTKIYQISWDGTTLTPPTQIASDISGGIEVGTPQMNGNQLQVRAYCVSSGNVTIDVRFQGLILFK